MNSIIKHLSILFILLGPLSVTKVMAEELPLSCSQRREGTSIYSSVQILECTATQDYVTVTDIIIDRGNQISLAPCKWNLKFGEKGRCVLNRQFLEANMTANGIPMTFKWNP